MDLVPLKTTSAELLALLENLKN